MIREIRKTTFLYLKQILRIYSTWFQGELKSVLAYIIFIHDLFHKLLLICFHNPSLVVLFMAHQLMADLGIYHFKRILSKEHYYQ